MYTSTASPADRSRGRDAPGAESVTLLQTVPTLLTSFLTRRRLLLCRADLQARSCVKPFDVDRAESQLGIDFFTNSQDTQSIDSEEGEKKIITRPRHRCCSEADEEPSTEQQSVSPPEDTETCGRRPPVSRSFNTETFIALLIFRSQFLFTSSEITEVEASGKIPSSPKAQNSVYKPGSKQITTHRGHTPTRTVNSTRRMEATVKGWIGIKSLYCTRTENVSMFHVVQTGGHFISDGFTELWSIGSCEGHVHIRTCSRVLDLNNKCECHISGDARLTISVLVVSGGNSSCCTDDASKHCRRQYCICCN
ncbi:hypothetical protein F2P81_002998 [Scophthalmus maximus]|uniref:Uncharacterized protein n=1 Tax=Scophthalmus maximus TaxID=52904 RepID=A0A6A4TJL0_SCOMX|nr:hypothetical protein F2P81_002998 [Scophthalmus maximus]